MSPNGNESYIFQGSAVGVALRCSQFKDNPLFFEGSSSLPPTGGNVESHSGPRRIELPGEGLILSFRHATSRVTGDFVNGENGPIRIVAEATLSELNILNRVRIEYLGNHLIYDEEGDGKRVKLSLSSPLQFVNVMVDERPLRVE